MLSETYSAQYGLGANQISVVSKSGTNNFHGALFEFDRNDAFDAENYFQSGPNTKLRQNQFGFVVDGPVRIPWLYNGKDKTFFMANYEGRRVSAGAGTGYTTRTHTGRIGWEFLHPGHGPYDRAAISGRATVYASIIPASRFSRLANVTISSGFIPAPNCSGCGRESPYNLILPSSSTLHANQQTYRIDEDMHKWGRLFGRGSYSTYNPFGTGGASEGRSVAAEPRKSTPIGPLGHTLNIGSHMVNQFIMGSDGLVPGQFRSPVHRFGSNGRSVSAAYSPISRHSSVLIPRSTLEIRMASNLGDFRRRQQRLHL